MSASSGVSVVPVHLRAAIPVLNASFENVCELHPEVAGAAAMSTSAG